jgi:hypothetical protein
MMPPSSLRFFIRSRVLHRGLGQREIEAKRSPLIESALDLNLAAVQFDDVSRNCEPKASAPGVACFTAIHAIVPVEDARQLITRNPATSIGDTHRQARAIE